MTIVDLSELRKNDREKKQEEKRKKKNDEIRKAQRLKEMIQVSATTIGMFIEAIQWAMTREFNQEQFEFLTNACNYQLTAFARAYGWPVQRDQIPIVLEMEVALDPESQQVLYDVSIEGELATDVQMILAANNPEMQAVPQENP